MTAATAAILDLRFLIYVTLVLPSEFHVCWPFGLGEEVKNRFSRWLLRQPSWISVRNGFSYFLIYKSPECCLHVWSQLAHRCRKSWLFLFLLVSGKGCGLWLWHSLEFSFTFFKANCWRRTTCSGEPIMQYFNNLFLRLWNLVMIDCTL